MSLSDSDVHDSDGDEFPDSDEDGPKRFDNFVPPKEAAERRATRAAATRQKKQKVARRSTAIPRKRAAVGGLATSSSGSHRSKRRAPVKKTRVNPRAVKNDPTIVISIDFGTTFSGSAFSWSDRRGRIHVISNLDDSNVDDPKVPTLLIYTERNASKILQDWANGARNMSGSLAWLKLLLLDDDDLKPEIRDSQNVQNGREYLRRLGKTPTEATADYLCVLWKSCLVKVKRAVGEETFVNSRFHVVITLPAIWPDYARQKMDEAARNAGILDDRDGVADTVLTFVSEPEAATLAILNEFDGAHGIKCGDCFVICDAGGGTVDIISYAVTKIGPMSFREVVRGDGDLCGAGLVTERFQLLLITKLCAVVEDAMDAVTPDEMKKIMIEDWERILREFDGVEERTWTILLPYSLIPLQHQNSMPMLGITTAELKLVFEPVIERIKSLVEDQVSAIRRKEHKDPKHIHLVGGFGRSKYLRKCLEEEFSEIEVLQLPNWKPWTAICEGAVIHGLNEEKMNVEFPSNLESRISRYSYGVIYQEKFNEENHHDEDKRWDAEHEEHKAINQMRWLVKVNEDVMVNHRHRADFFKIYEKKPKSISTEIWMSPTSPPPSRKDDTVTLGSKVRWDPKIDWDQLDTFINGSKKKFMRLDFATEMRTNGGATEFTVFHESKRQALQDMSVGFHDRAGF